MKYTPDTDLYKGISETKLPKSWFRFYVIYKYSFNKSTLIVGFDTDVDADKLQKELLTRKEITRCEVFGHYPLDLLKEDS